MNDNLDDILDKVAFHVHAVYMQKIKKLAGELALEIHEISGKNVLQTQAIYQLIINKFKELDKLVGL